MNKTLSHTRHLLGHNIKLAAIIFTSLSTFTSASEANAETSGREFLVSALKTSKAEKYYQFEKELSWDGPLFMGISVRGGSSKGTFVHPHVRYFLQNQRKGSNESYFIDGALYARTSTMSNKMNDWKKAPMRSMASLLVYPFDINNTKSSITSTSKNIFEVKPPAQTNKTAITKALEERHGDILAEDEDIDWKKSTLKWTINLDQKNRLIKSIEQHITIHHKEPQEFDSNKSKHHTKLTFNYNKLPDQDNKGIKIPAELKKLLDTDNK